MTTSVITDNAVLFTQPSPEGQYKSSDNFFLDEGAKLLYVLPAPAGRYVEGPFLCSEQKCCAAGTFGLGCPLEACEAQFCNFTADGGK